MARGLFTRIDREIRPEHIERRLADANGAPVAGCADDARARQSRDHAFKRSIHCSRVGNFIADKPPLRAVALQPALVLYRLARDAVAGEAGEAHLVASPAHALPPPRL